MTRQSYRIDRTGALSNLHRVTEPIPPLGANDVLIEVRAIGLNFADIFAMFGLYSATPKGSFIPGLEYAGVVVECGQNVRHIALGDRVMGAIRFGAYTTHVVVDAQYVQPLPEGWSFLEGAAFLVQSLTAYYALKHLGGLEQFGAFSEQPAPTVLIHSAAGGVGLLAHRIAKTMMQGRVITIGTIGNAAKRALLEREGYDHVIVRSGSSRASAEHFRAALQSALDGRPLHLILDSLGGSLMRVGYETLAPAGRVVCFGSAHLAFQGNRPNYPKLLWKYFQRPRFDPLQMIEDNKAILGFNLIYLWNNLPLLQQMVDELISMRLPKPFVGHVFPFEHLPEALTMFQSGSTTGKVVITLEA
jgi:alcohol dehydrogenase